uniref:Uncharacterized protein n=1 Tax=Arundo donax TaxID=35708 RepID=A0A0A9A0M0_ARUDO
MSGPWPSGAPSSSASPTRSAAAGVTSPSTASSPRSPCPRASSPTCAA